MIAFFGGGSGSIFCSASAFTSTLTSGLSVLFKLLSTETLAPVGFDSGSSMREQMYIAQAS